MTEENKQFTEIIRETFRKISPLYFAATVIGISGVTGCSASHNYEYKYETCYDYEYNRFCERKIQYYCVKTKTTNHGKYDSERCVQWESEVISTSCLGKDVLTQSCF